jgi:hypothetical protein
MRHLQKIENREKRLVSAGRRKFHPSSKKKKPPVKGGSDRQIETKIDLPPQKTPAMAARHGARHCHKGGGRIYHDLIVAF